MEIRNNSNIPSEKEVLDLIIGSVDIRGIELESYRYKFKNDESGLYDGLVKLFSNYSNNNLDLRLPIKCQGSWYPKYESVILVESEEDIEPLFEALCKQDDYWKSYKNLIKVAPKSIDSISDIEHLCEYCGKTDIYNIEEIKQKFNFLIYQIIN